MAGINTYLNNKAAASHYLEGLAGQSNCSGPGLAADYAAKYLAPIPGTSILYNGVVSQLQLGVNNKNNMTVNNDAGGYELTLNYNLNEATGKNIYIAKRDQGGTQLYNDTGSASITSASISVASKSFTIGTGLTYSVGQNVIAVHDASNYMIGVCSGYNSGTGAFTMNAITVVGSGTYATWTISLVTWSHLVRNQYCDQWLEYIYDVIDHCESNGIRYKILLAWVHGEEDGLNTTKATAYAANLEAFFTYVISKIHEYIQANYVGRIIPHIKVLIFECGSNAGAGGISVRSGQAAFVAKVPTNRKLVTDDDLTFNVDNVHLNAAAFTLKGEGEAKTDVLAFW